jgi:hypothetical protein
VYTGGYVLLSALSEVLSRADTPHIEDRDPVQHGTGGKGCVELRVRGASRSK